VCVDKGSEFYLIKLKKDTVVLIPAKLQVKHGSHAWCVQDIRGLKLIS
jgi:hypothetical protein